MFHTSYMKWFLSWINTSFQNIIYQTFQQTVTFVDQKYLASFPCSGRNASQLYYGSSVTVVSAL